MAVPGTPTSLALVAKKGLIEASWNAPSNPLGFFIQVSETSGFASFVEYMSPGAFFDYTINQGLTPGVQYWVRVAGYNNDGVGSYSTSANTTMPARTPLDGLRAASVTIPLSGAYTGGHQVEVRSDGADAAPTYTLGVVPFDNDATFTTIGVLTPGTDYDSRIGLQNGRSVSLAVAPNGDFYLFGIINLGTEISVVRYARTGSTTWSRVGRRIFSVPGGQYNGNIQQVVAEWAPGTGSTPVDRILVLTRRAGTAGAGSVQYSTLNPAALTNGGIETVAQQGVDPSWMQSPTSGGANLGHVDVVRILPTRFAVIGHGWAVIDITNGVIGSRAKSSGTADIAAIRGAWARVAPFGDGTWALSYSGATGVVETRLKNSLGQTLQTFSNNVAGGDNGWDIWADQTTKRLHIVRTDTTNPRTLTDIALSSASNIATSATLTTTLGASGDNPNTLPRVPRGTVDERRVIIETAALNGSTRKTNLFADRRGNVAPNAPALVDELGFDAAYARTFQWAFSDGNPADRQGAYQLQIRRVSDSVVVVDTNKVTSGSMAYTLAANGIANGVDYQWRVRTYDASDVVGAWSAYDSFTTAALGLLTVTAPAADDPAGLVTNTIPTTWSYSQVDGYVQTQRRVRVLNAATSAVISDTGFVTTTSQSFATPVPTDVRVAIEVSIKTNGPGTPTVTAAPRYVTSSYGRPMLPTFQLSFAAGWVEVDITNPPNTGSQPLPYRNVIRRRVAGSGATYDLIGVADVNGIYRDYTALMGVTYEYTVTAQALDSEITTDPAEMDGPQFQGIWLHDVADPTGTARNFRYQGGNRKESVSRQSAKTWMQGRQLPIVDYGIALDDTVAWSGEIPNGPTHADEVAWWRTVAVGGGTLFYKDNRGRGFYTSLPGGVDITDTDKGTIVSATFPRIDFEVIV